MVHQESERGNLHKTQSNNINRDNGAEIPEAWIPTIRKTSKPTTHEKTCERLRKPKYMETIAGSKYTNQKKPP